MLFVLTKEPANFRAALDAARLGTAVQDTVLDPPATVISPIQDSKIQSQSPVVVNALHTSIDTLTEMVSNISSRLDKIETGSKANTTSHRVIPPNRSQGRQRPQRTVICWRCGYRGHKVVNCYAIRGIDGRPLN